MRKDIALIALIVASLTLMVVPLSPDIIDVLLALNISLSVILLMVSVYIKHPSDFSTFPSVILIGTAFRLSLSIATTRLILSEAEAGQIIETFGEFVVSGSVVIGLVIFLIVTVVQFIVVTKGAERVAEVGARFALDALPGKQLSIDAEARAGNMTAEQATEARKRLDRDSRFFGAMDGAMKFVKGDAIAGIIIICINLLGGVAVGMSVHGYSFSEAVSVFSLLTVGDGLVAQLPALLMSLCAGIITTRTNGQDGTDLGSDISAEMIADPRVPAIGAPIVLAIGLIPGFPFWVFAAMAATMLIVSFTLRQRLRREAATRQAAAEQAATEAAAQDGAAPVSDRFALAIGRDLAEEVDVDGLRSALADHLEALYAARGVRFPNAEVKLGGHAHPREMIVEIDEVPVFRCRVPADRTLVSDHGPERVAKDAPESDLVEWPGIKGAWLTPQQMDRARGLEDQVIAIGDALAFTAFRVYERNLGILFSNDVFSELMAEARGTEQDLMTRVEAEISEPSLYAIMKYLVEDGVPLRPLSLFISSIQTWLTSIKEPTPLILAECLRGSMRRQLCHRLAGDEGVLGLAMLGPEYEALARSGVAKSQKIEGEAAGDGLVFSPDVSEGLLAQVRALGEPYYSGGRQAVIVVSADLRRRFRNYLAANGQHLPVLAPHEISLETASYPLDLIERPAPPKAEPARKETKRAPKRRTAAKARA